MKETMSSPSTGLKLNQAGRRYLFFAVTAVQNRGTWLRRYSAVAGSQEQARFSPHSDRLPCFCLAFLDICTPKKCIICLIKM